MFCKSFWKNIVSFILSFAVSLIIVNTLNNHPVENKIRENLYQSTDNSDSGIGSCSSSGKLNLAGSRPIKPLRLISTPAAKYTDTARQNNVQGSVTLRINFQANGKIGNISVANILPGGLTEQAIAAARKIKFKPARRDGIPITVIKSIQYSFSLN